MHLKSKALFLSFIIILFTIVLQLSPNPYPIFADWIVDLTPPSCTFSFQPVRPTTAGNTVKATITYRTPPNDTPSTISYVAITSVTGGNLSPNPCQANSYTRECNWNTNNLSGTYTFNGTIKDTAGNTGYCQDIYQVNINNPPWLQTTGGDVHSNR